ncbi:hypothetical protein RHSIM_RhsimUnG0204300 [Rhododendron simsii]|uniref:VQ domain-containing protein n=1 Tax=Rhododendron simsii TaxID=118357 RepID=A0A834L3K2_RHOSS|nr:hypothetical protein RHSIM_RhsimUnG0204300 [Rhododendron simsii]
MSRRNAEPVKITFINTEYVETDATSFKSVVQKLTGKDSTIATEPKSGRVGSKVGMSRGGTGELVRVCREGCRSRILIGCSRSSRLWTTSIGFVRTEFNRIVHVLLLLLIV